MSKTQIVLIGISILAAAASGYCFGKARAIIEEDAHAEYWYRAYCDAMKALEKALKID
jgi:hypothetical protein